MFACECRCELFDGAGGVGEGVGDEDGEDEFEDGVEVGEGDRAEFVWSEREGERNE